MLVCPKDEIKVRILCTSGKENALTQVAWGQVTYLICGVFVEHGGASGRNQKARIWGQFSSLSKFVCQAPALYSWRRLGEIPALLGPLDFE